MVIGKKIELGNDENAIEMVYKCTDKILYFATKFFKACMNIESKKYITLRRFSKYINATHIIHTRGGVVNKGTHIIGYPPFI